MVIEDLSISLAVYELVESVRDIGAADLEIERDHRRIPNSPIPPTGDSRPVRITLSSPWSRAEEDGDAGDARRSGGH